MLSKSKSVKQFEFVWRVIFAHMIAYFIAGIFSVQVMDYRQWFLNGTISLFMLPVDAPIVALGPALQVIRGMIMALVLLPLRKVFIEEKYGFFKLWWLILGLSVFSTYAAAMGSIDGFIYTKVPFFEQILGYPEAFLWITLFVGFLWVFYRFEKKVIDLIAFVLVCLIFFMSIMGYSEASGIITLQH